MELAKGFLQGSIVVVWAVYAAARILAAAGGGADGPADPTGGVALLVAHLERMPVESLVLPTAAMVAGVVGLEVVFAAVRRYGRP